VLLTASKSIEYLLLDGPKTLDLESLEVYFHLQNISRFQSVLEKNKASRDQLWSLKQVEDASLLKSRDSLATIRLSQTRDAEGLRRAENKVSEGEETVQKMEKRLNDVNNATKVSRSQSCALSSHVTGPLEGSAVAQSGDEI
jgi:hypothetical protein